MKVLKSLVTKLGICSIAFIMCFSMLNIVSARSVEGDFGSSPATRVAYQYPSEWGESYVMLRVKALLKNNQLDVLNSELLTNLVISYENHGHSGRTAYCDYAGMHQIGHKFLKEESV